MKSTNKPWWRNRNRLAFIAFVIIAGFFLWTEHRAHIAPYLIWILLGACLLMHVFMHGGYGGHGHDADDPENNIKR